MDLRARSFPCLLMAVVLGQWYAARPANACGGCFTRTDSSSPTVVTGHQMAVALSPARTVLWDQIVYDGAPEDFSWVLPVQGAARLELASDAWFDMLQGTTAVRVSSPPYRCSPGFSGDSGGGGCGSTTGGGSSSSSSGAFSSAPPPVQVVHRETVGPYETVTLRSTNPNALHEWLATNGYGVPDDVEPILTAYVLERFDFIALKLQPTAGVASMKPVRVVTEGASFAFPLRMVAAGTGAEVGLTLYVIGEGRFEVENSINRVVDQEELEWDFGKDASNYSALRAEQLATNGGNVWLTTFAKRGVLLEAQRDGGNNLVAFSGSAPNRRGYYTNTMIGALFGQAEINREVVTGNCDGIEQNARAYADSTAMVVDLCNADGKDCRTPTNLEIDHRMFNCGLVDDLGTALVGSHPAAVWVTRLEANLPRSALGQDLVLNAGVQTEVQNAIQTRRSVGEPCLAQGTDLNGSMGALALLWTPFVLGMTVRRRRSTASR